MKGIREAYFHNKNGVAIQCVLWDTVRGWAYVEADNGYVGWLRKDRLFWL